MTLGLVFSAPAIAMHERGNVTSAYILTFLSLAYSVTVLTAWCVFVFALYAAHADKNSLIPVLIWSYSVATTPVVVLAHYDLRRGVQNSGTLAFFTFFSCIIVSLEIFTEGFSLPTVSSIFGSVMFIALLILLSDFYLARKSR